MRIYDISRTISEELRVYPGEPGLARLKVKSRAAGDRANVSLLTLGAHAGTHVDAPCHFLDRAEGVDAWPVEQLCGPARVVEIHDPRAVDVPELERYGLEGVERVLFKTRNGELDGAFHDDYVFIAPEAAE